MKDSELTQLHKPYESTIRFEKFLKENRLLTKKNKQNYRYWFWYRFEFTLFFKKK